MTQSQSNSPNELEEQKRFWNFWNTKHRVENRKLPQVNERQARTVTGWLSTLGRTNLDILEVGCGSGWMCGQLAGFGRVTGTDLANEVLPRADTAPQGVTFVAGDYFKLEFPPSGFDVIVSLETLAHVGDQEEFVEKTARLLRPGGYLMLATQNRFALERWSEVVPRAPGQIRKWVDAKALRRLLSTHFKVVELRSIFPVGDRGILRWINADMVNRVLSAFMSQARIDALKERLFLGHTLVVLAQKPGGGVPR